MAERARLILASGSAARARMLAAAGLTFDVVPAEVDEQRFRQMLWSINVTLIPPQLAEALAVLKAEDVSRRHPSAIVIGGDQVLAHDGKLLSKASDAAGATAVLKRLRGATHELHSAAVIARGGNAVWRATDTARLTMRDVSDTFLTDYVASSGDSILRSVGCYEIEGHGLQLFDRVEGDHFTIQGLPLLPLLAELRRLGVIAS